MLQADGLAAVLAGGSLRVSDGTSEATAPLDDGYPAVDGGLVVLRATFGADVANFEWVRRDVLTAAGSALDVEDEDNGRKAPGAIWTLTTTLSTERTDG